MFLPVLFGAIIGIVGFLPLLFALKMSKKVTKTSNFGYGTTLILGVVFSLLILFASVIICYVFYKDVLIAFALSCAITLSVFAIIFGIYTAIRREKEANYRKNK